MLLKRIEKDPFEPIYLPFEMSLFSLVNLRFRLSHFPFVCMISSVSCRADRFDLHRSLVFCFSFSTLLIYFHFLFASLILMKFSVILTVLPLKIVYPF